MRVVFVTTLFFVCVNQWSVRAFEVIPERAIVDFYNKTYISFMNINVRRLSRKSPYQVNLEFEALSAFGNNVTLIFTLMEYLSNGYQPTVVTYTLKLCDFFRNEQFIGHMIAKQLPAGWTCPFKIGRHNFVNLTIHLETFHYKIPFTWAAVNMKTRADFDGYETNTKNRLFALKVYLKMIIKPNKKV